MLKERGVRPENLPPAEDVKKVEKDCDRDNYMSTEDALKYGLIDKIIDKRPDILTA